MGKDFLLRNVYICLNCSSRFEASSKKTPKECPKCHWKNSLYEEKYLIQKTMRASKSDKKNQGGEDIADQIEIIFWLVLRVLFLVAFFVLAGTYLWSRFHR